MKLAHYLDGKAVKIGVVDGGRVFSVTNTDLKTIDQVLSSGTSMEQIQRTGSGKALSSVTLTSPILSPEKIICVAANYLEHVRESKRNPPPEPYLFSKFRNALIGPGDDIILPRVSKKVDWEVELAVVIGREGKYIREEDALGHVAGYTISNDISCRDFQKAYEVPGGSNPFGQNWLLGKSTDHAFPLGPWLVSADEIPNPHRLRISLSINGRVKQDSNTSELIFRIQRLIAHASKGLTLKPGDIISTGTPHGVGAATGEYLKDGDVVECSIESIGTLRNVARAER